MHADFDELVYRTASPHDGPFIDRDVARYLNVVGDDDVVPDRAVMCNMYISHQKAILADFRNFFIYGPPIDGDAFPDGGMVSNFNAGFFTLEF